MEKKRGDPRAENLYGLGPEDENHFYAICEGDTEKVKTARLLFNSQRATNTGKNYKVVIQDFQDFCDTNKSYSYAFFGKKEIFNFIVSTHEKGKGRTYVSYIRPAISTLEAARGIAKEDSVFHDDTVVAMLAGAKRRAAELAPPIRKVDELPLECLKKGLQVFVWARDLQDIDFVTFRTLYRWLVEAMTLVRFEGFRHVKTKHVTIVQDSQNRKAVSIYFQKEKNDQLHMGQIRMLPEQPGQVIEPLTLTLLYFQRAGFQLGKGEEFISCRSKNRGKDANGQYPLRYATAMENGRELAKKLGFNIRYGENSARRLGASNARRNKVPMDVIAEVGGWKTKGMVERYTSNTVETKIGQALDLKFQ